MCVCPRHSETFQQPSSSWVKFLFAEIKYSERFPDGLKSMTKLLFSFTMPTVKILPHTASPLSFMVIFLSMLFLLVFMYGEQNSSLSYLRKLKANNMELAEIQCSGHWPMYSNPVAMWDRIERFILCQSHVNGGSLVSNSVHL